MVNTNTPERKHKVNLYKITCNIQCVFILVYSVF